MGSQYWTIGLFTPFSRKKVNSIYWQ